MTVVENLEQIAPLFDGQVGEPPVVGRYHCQGGLINHGGDRCISFGGMRIDREVGTEVIERLQPLGIEAALSAQAVRSRASEDKRRQVELALEQARYEVGRARRQYDAVDPDNRLVAAGWRGDGTSGCPSSAIWRPNWMV